jgi:hypothetical protein
MSSRLPWTNADPSRLSSERSVEYSGVELRSESIWAGPSTAVPAGIV